MTLKYVAALLQNIAKQHFDLPPGRRLGTNEGL